MRYSFSCIEPLEPRIAPAALTAKLLDGLLKIAGDPVSGALIVKQTGSSIEVFDDVTSLGVFSGVKSIDLRPTGGVGVALVLDGDGLPGPCNITATGPTAVDVAQFSHLNGGLKFIGDATPQNLTLFKSVSVGKALVFKGSEGNDTLTFRDGVTIGGNLALTLVEGVNFNGQNAPVSIGGNFTVANADDTIPVDIETTGLTSAVNVSGGFTYFGGRGSDSIFLAASVSKSVKFVDRVGGNQLVFASGSVVQGSVTMTGGAGSDFFGMQGGRIDGNLTLKLAGGNNTLNYGASNIVTIGGNLTMTTTNGDDRVDGLTTIKVTKNVSLRLGDGTNTVAAPITVFGAKFLLTTGSGMDSVNCIGEAKSAAALVSLGDGADTLDGVLFTTVLSANFQGGGGIDTYAGGIFVADPIVVRSFEIFP